MSKSPLYNDFQSFSSIILPLEIAIIAEQSLKVHSTMTFRECSVGETATPMNALHQLPSALIHTGPPRHRICELPSAFIDISQ